MDMKSLQNSQNCRARGIPGEIPRVHKESCHTEQDELETPSPTELTEYVGYGIEVVEKTLPATGYF